MYNADYSASNVAAAGPSSYTHMPQQPSSQDAFSWASAWFDVPSFASGRPATSDDEQQSLHRAQNILDMHMDAVPELDRACFIPVRSCVSLKSF